MSEYLLTGGCGFLGSNMTRYLLNKGHRVIIVDDLCTGEYANIKDIKDDVVYYTVSVENKKDLERIVESHKIDYIFNFACPASPKQYQRMPLKTLDTCYLGVKNVLDMANNLKCGMMQMSTSEVYGDPPSSPQSESDLGNVNSYGPRSCYDEGKRIAEALCYEYAMNYDVRCHIPRIFNTYGPYMRGDDGRVISEFIVNALVDKDLVIFGDGSSTRSFCYVNDMIEGLYKLHLSDSFNEPINMGMSEEIDLFDLAEKIVYKCKSNSKIRFTKRPKDDPHIRKPCIKKAQQQLRWEPVIELDEGLEKTISYFRSTLR